MVPFLTDLQKQWDIYKQAELPSKACDVHKAEFMDIITHLGPRAWYPVRQCCEALQIYNEKTPGLFRTDWDGDGIYGDPQQ